jgi:hypothetical protein
MQLLCNRSQHNFSDLNLLVGFNSSELCRRDVSVSNMTIISRLRCNTVVCVGELDSWVQRSFGGYYFCVWDEQILNQKTVNAFVP